MSTWSKAFTTTLQLTLHLTVKDGVFPAPPRGEKARRSALRQLLGTVQDAPDSAVRGARDPKAHGLEEKEKHLCSQVTQLSAEKITKNLSKSF